MNRNYPMTPEKEPDTKPRAGKMPTQDKPPICVGRVDDIPETPQLRRRPESLAEEERRAGIATVVFSVTVAAVALFVCLLVAVMTVRTALPSQGNSKPNGTNAGTAEPTPSDSGTPLFTPGAAVLPKNGANTKSISGINSNYAVLVDAQTGEILAGKDADTRFSPASMTKVMTLIVACENLKTGDLDKKVEYTEALSEYIKGKGLSTYGFKVGQCVRIEDLLVGIGVESAADCVIMVVSYICPAATPAESEAAFVELMNAEVQKMGLKNTQFDNAAGDESNGNKSTASDIAAIMIYALGCERIKEILSTRDALFYLYDTAGNKDDTKRYFLSTLYRTSDADGSREWAYKTKYGNFQLSELKFGGGKTGTLGEKPNYIYSLVSFATGGGKTYIVVTGETTVGADVLKDAKTIYDNYIN